MTTMMKLYQLVLCCVGISKEPPVQYGTYCPVADILPGGGGGAKYWPILPATHNMCDLYLPRPKNGWGRDRVV